MEITNKMIADRIDNILEIKKDTEIIKNKAKYLAEISGVGESTIRHIFADTPGRGIAVDNLVKIADALDVSVYYLLTGISEENHDVCEDLGLSDKSIETIRFYKKHEWQNNSLNALISDNQLMNHILYYLSEEYDELRIWDEDEGTFFWKKIEDVWNLHPGDLERIERLRIMDNLKRLKDSIKEERENGKTGKR